MEEDSLSASGLSCDLGRKEETREPQRLEGCFFDLYDDGQIPHCFAQ